MGEDRTMIKQVFFFYVLISCLTVESFACSHCQIIDTLPRPIFEKDLPEVIVSKKRMPISIHGDTLSYEAKQYSDVHTPKLQDLLRKMPGFRVDDGGHIFFNGKEVSKILIDGDDLSGNRYTVLSRNLRASLVKQLQVVQQFQENRLMKGHVLSDAIALNIKINDEYRGKPTGNVFALGNFRNYGAVNGDLLRLRQHTKQLLFLDKNNIGDEGLSDDYKSVQLGESVNIDENYTSWPFSDHNLKQHAFISSRYRRINNDVGVMNLTSNKLGKYVKMRTETNIAKRSLLHFSNTLQRINIPGITPIEVFSLLSTRNTSNKGSVRFVVDRDNNRRRVSRYAFYAGSDLMYGAMKENRNLADNMLRHFHQQHFTGVLSIQQQETWAIGKNGLLLIENSFGLDNHRQHLKINDQAFFKLPYIKHIYPYDQLFSHKGSQFNSHIGRVVSFSAGTLRYGVRGSFQSIYSVLDKNEHRYFQYKNYAYFSIVKKFILKSSQEFQFAVGSANYAGISNSAKSKMIFRAEHSMTWQIRKLSTIRFGGNFGRAAPDLKLFHAGPLFSQYGVFLSPPTQITYPVSAEFHIDLTKMDLYKGFIAMLSVRYRQALNEQGIATMITPYFSGTAYFIMPEQKNISMVTNVEQFIFSLKMKYVFNGSLLFMRMPQQLNHQIFQSAIYTMGIDHKMISNWKGRLNIEINYRSDRSYFTSLSKQSSGSQFRRFHYRLHGNVKINNIISGGVYYTGIQTDRKNYFSMFDARFKAKLGNRFTTSIELVNLLNNQYYREQTVGLYTSQSFALLLNGRRILFGLNYSF